MTTEPTIITPTTGPAGEPIATPPAGVCCDPSTTASTVDSPHATVATCCGTATEAHAEGRCCGAAAKERAVAAGASCCG